MNKLALAGALALALSSPVLAQGIPLARQPGTTGTVVTRQPNTTGNASDVVISRGATGADTITSSSAAGGNANLPERAIPNGSAGGGGSGRYERPATTTVDRRSPVRFAAAGFLIG